MVKRKKPLEEISLISVRVRNFDARVAAGLNFKTQDKEYQHDDMRVFEFSSALEISGICSYPDDRANSEVVVTVYGDDPGQGRLDSRLKDYHVRDDKWELKFRKYKGKSLPVYNLPKGIGILDKVRGENSWRGVVWVANQTVTQMLALLHLNQGLYMGINEVKVSRNRWIRDFDLRTSDPAYD